MFADLDVLVCDIQDIGVRYYTFASTITYLIEVAGEVGVPVLLLDRPNPLGDAIDGLRVSEGYQSLVGRFAIPAQHGLTLGELVRLVNARFNDTCRPNGDSVPQLPARTGMGKHRTALCSTLT